jgi:hypothetical protein
LTRRIPATSSGQAGIGGFVDLPPDRGEPHINRCWHELLGFELCPICEHHSTIHRRPRFRTIPVYELVRHMLMRPARLQGRKLFRIVQDLPFGLVEFRQGWTVCESGLL